VGFLLVLEEIEGCYREIEGRLKDAIGRVNGDWRAWKGLGSLEGILKASIGRLESLEKRLESLEGRLKVAICKILEGRLKATVVIFNHHWTAKEVGSKVHSCFFLISMCCKLEYYYMLNT